MKHFVTKLETALALSKHELRAFATKGKLEINGHGLQLSLSSRINLGKNATLTIGRNFIMGRQCKIVVYPNATLTIDDNVTLTDNDYIQCMGEMNIGSDIGFAPYCFVIDYNHDYKQKKLVDRRKKHFVKNVMIKDNAWIGAHVVILPGVTIGEHAVIGANSTVTKSICDYGIAVGNPAKVIKTNKVF